MKIIQIKDTGISYLVNAITELDLTDLPFSYGDVMNNTLAYTEAINETDVHNDETGRLYYEDKTGEWYWAVYNKERKRYSATDENGLTHHNCWTEVEEIEKIYLINRMQG